MINQGPLLLNEWRYRTSILSEVGSISNCSVFTLNYILKPSLQIFFSLPQLQLELTFSYLEIHGVTCSKPAQVSVDNRNLVVITAKSSPLDFLKPWNSFCLVLLLKVSWDNLKSKIRENGSFWMRGRWGWVRRSRALVLIRKTFSTTQVEKN